MLMRRTWLNPTQLTKQIGLKVKIVYFTGKSKNRRDQQRMLYESELYKDIVQSDFIDEYANNTYKAMSYLL